MRLILVGFGIYREHIEIMIRAMVTGDKELFKSAAHCVDELGCSFLESSVDIDQTFQKLGKISCSLYFRIETLARVLLIPNRRILNYNLTSTVPVKL